MAGNNARQMSIATTYIASLHHQCDDTFLLQKTNNLKQDC